MTPEKHSPKEKRMVARKRDQTRFVWAALSFVFGLLVGYLLWGGQPTQPAAKPADEIPAAENRSGQRADIPIDGFPSVGPKDAPIVLVEFSDFGCSFCAKWHNETYEELMAAYPEQIRFVYRDVPFRAFPASEAAQCARQQDAFWAYHDKLFGYEYGLSDEAYLQYAQDLNLDMDEFVSCLNEHRYEAMIQRDLDAARELGISSTPTFFINGIQLVGAQPIEAFKQLIDKELANAE